MAFLPTIQHDAARPAGEGSARDRKKRATRRAIRRAATALVGDRGLGSVTVEEIALAAGVSPRTFFNYFPTKEDAVVGWDPDQLAEITAQLLSRPAAEGPLEALRATLLGCVAPADADHRDLLGRLEVIQADPQLAAHQARRFGDTERALVEALTERRGSDPSRDHYARLVVACVLAGTRAALMAWCDEQGRVPLDRVLAAHLDVLGAGLAESGRAAGAVGTGRAMAIRASRRASRPVGRRAGGGRNGR